MGRSGLDCDEYMERRRDENSVKMHLSIQRSHARTDAFQEVLFILF